jgi:hypothetical protein
MAPQLARAAGSDRAEAPSRSHDVRKNAHQNLIAAMVANGLSIFLMHRSGGLRSHRSVKSFSRGPRVFRQSRLRVGASFCATDWMMGEQREQPTCAPDDIEGFLGSRRLARESQ